jgi:hypothetical protein
MGEAASSYGGGGAGDQGPTQAMLGGGGGIGSLASPLSIASLGLSAFASISKGKGTQAADEFQAARAERAADFGKLQASLTDTTLRENLNTTLSNIEVIRAASHDDPTSPTGIAFEQRQQLVSDRQRNAALLTINSQVAEDQASAKYLRDAGDYALKMGYVDAAIGVTGGLGKALAARNKQQQQE